MYVHHYHPETREYLSSSETDLDPLETKLAGEPRYLIPEHALPTPPPEVPTGHVARATDSDWEIVEDHRGEQYWLPEDDWTHASREMTDLGPLPEGVVLTRPEMPEDVRLALAADTIRSERDRRLTACDYLMMPDYPLSEEQRTAWAAYRQALRDLPELEGFPWAGADDPAVPWPVEPVGEQG